MQITTTQTRADQAATRAAASDGEWRSIGQVADAVVLRALAELDDGRSRATINQTRAGCFPAVAVFDH